MTRRKRGKGPQETREHKAGKLARILLRHGNLEARLGGRRKFMFINSPKQIDVHKGLARGKKRPGGIVLEIRTKGVGRLRKGPPRRRSKKRGVSQKESFLGQYEFGALHAGGGRGAGSISITW